VGEVGDVDGLRRAHDRRRRRRRRRNLTPEEVREDGDGISHFCRLI
jgi:hypothetical protein